jgi:hypothetical protein
VSILHNPAHLLFGVTGIAMSRRVTTANFFLLGGGVVYLILSVSGLVIEQDSAANFVPVNSADNCHIWAWMSPWSVWVCSPPGSGSPPPPTRPVRSRLISEMPPHETRGCVDSCCSARFFTRCLVSIPPGYGVGSGRRCDGDVEARSI